MTCKLLLTPVVAMALSGCATPRRRRGESPRPTMAPVERSERPASKDVAVVGQTLVYPVRWGRADELAATLEPYLLSRYGPGVRIVPQVQSNKLLIYVPSRLEREAAQERQAAPAVRSR